MSRLRFLAVAGVLALWTALVASIASAPPGRVVWRNVSPYVWLFQGAPLEASYYPTTLKSLQRGTITITTAAGTTATITSVNTGAAYVQLLGMTVDTSSSFNLGLIELTNATTVTAKEDPNSTAATTVMSFQVVELLLQFVKSLQKGVVAFSGATTGSTTITSVNTAKAQLVFLGYRYTDNSGTDPIDYARLTLTSATVVGGTRTTALGAAEAGFMVVEYK